MSTIPAKAAKLIEDGAVKLLERSAPIYLVQSGTNIYECRIIEGQASCTCRAGREGYACSHAQAAQDLDAQTPARTRAFDAASSALRTLWAIVDDEDLGNDEGCRTALLEALDSFDIAENIDKEWRDS